MAYRVLIGKRLIEKTGDYADQLTRAASSAGALLARRLPQTRAPLTANRLLQALLETRQPQIFAESQIAGDGTDWNHEELSILGDLSIAAEVLVYDDGKHTNPTPHREPFPGTLVFTCGALLRSGHGHPTPDLAEVAADGVIDEATYAGLYARRLGPVFEYIQTSAERRDRGAVVTVPGLGCGQFAGRFQGQLGPILQLALNHFLEAQAPALSRIQAVVYDPYTECSDTSEQFGTLEFRTRPLAHSANPHPQLCPPTDYQEGKDDFGDCDLYSLVAWDHVSWPGNDFFIGSRATDDGVKAAATSSMHAMTEIEGRYDAGRAMYLPPTGYQTWGECVDRNDLHLELGVPFVQT